MDIDLSPEQLAFRADVRRFIAERLPAEVRERLRQGHLPNREETIDWQRALAERGWAAPHWPKQYGGAELGLVERLILLDELQRAPAPVPQVFNINMLGPVLLEFGTPAQRDYFLPRLARLDLWFCQGFSEPEAGSDLAALRTTAQRRGDVYVVNGQKTWTSMAHYADWMFALVRTSSEGRKQEGISFLMIDLKTPGITIRPIWSIDGSRHLNEVFLDNVEVPVSNLVGEENKGWDCARFLLVNERSGIANVGLCRERLEMARELATQRRRAGRSLIDDPALRHELALLDAEVRALEVTNQRFLLTASEQARLPAFASVLKLKGTELQQQINELIATLAGPLGLERAASHEAATHWLVPRYFFSRATSIYGGSSEIQKEILARALLG
jgi:pimeloyl-CoA dehydrogenase